MAKLSLNSISPSVFKVNASEVADGSATRATIVSAGRTLMTDYARKGQKALYAVMKKADAAAPAMLSAEQYKVMNERFQAEHLLYAANKVCEFTGESAPQNFDEFKAMGQKFYGNAHFYAVLQGIYQEIVTPILPRVYSEAVDVFADTVEVGFGETYALSVSSNDIPVFQDSAWGAAMSAPRNEFYAKDYVLNPKPRTAAIKMKWVQLVSNGVDFGQFFANLTAGMYAKTMGLWNAAMTAAATNPALVPAALSVVFNATNWVTLTNKIAAVNATNIANTIAFGNAVALSRVLPTEQTGSTNVQMDAALAMLLGADYIRAGYMGEYMGTRLMPLTDAVIPGTQNTNPTTILDPNTVWIMASNGRKPMTIGYNSATPITIEITPERTADFTMNMVMTMAIDSVATFVNKVGIVTV